MARKPSQSPIDEMTCVSHRRQNAVEPNTRTCTPGRKSSLTTAEGPVGASGPGASTPGTSTRRCYDIGSTLWGARAVARDPPSAEVSGSAACGAAGALLGAAFLPRADSFAAPAL